MIKTQFQTTIQIFRTDNGREYFNNILNRYLSSEGIIHQSSCPNTPQQNGVSERKNRHLLDVARALMYTTNVPYHFWGEAVLTAAYLINRMPSRVLEFQTPCEILLGVYPHTKLITRIPVKIFGCSVFVHKQNPSKLQPRSLKCIFLGYSPTQKGYKCYSPTLKRYFISKNVTFMENSPYYSKTKIHRGRVS